MSRSSSRWSRLLAVGLSRSSRRMTGMNRVLCIAGLMGVAATACAQAPLPPNYKTILNNTDVQVMHVHYGAHEFVPMHDHPAVSTMYVYLNHSGEVDLI